MKRKRFSIEDRNGATPATPEIMNNIVEALFRMVQFAKKF